jgi:hypothetical protein
MQTEQKKVFGLGFSKTGTTSLEKAFSILGYKVCAGHYNNNYTNFLIALYVNGDYKELTKFATLFDAFADGPWGGGKLYRHLYEQYPDAHYILTIREPEKWYKSFEKMITRFDPDLNKAFDTFYANGRYGTPYFFKHIFGIETMYGSKDKMIAYYNEYNKDVIAFFKESKKDLLVVDLTDGEGWDKICPFLEKQKPLVPFPHENAAPNKINNTVDAKNNQGLFRRIIKKTFK